MPHEVVRWAFHSPLRLLMVGLAVAAIVVGGVTVAGSEENVHTAVSDSASKARPRPATPSPPKPTPSEGITASDRQAATEAARAFVDTWTSGSDKSMTRGRWLRAIRPMATASLFRGLRLTDLDRVPEGRVRKVQLNAVGAFSAEFTVRLDSGLSLHLGVVRDGGRWAVSDIRPVAA